MDEDDCTLCGARTWKAERGKGGRRPCCDAGKTEIPAPECDLNDPTPIDRLMSEVEVGDDGKMRRTRRCKQFHENIVAYNNSVSFASEGVDNVDRNVAPFTFRMQGNIYHQLPPLPVDGERPRFAQIYTVDSTPQQADDRLHYNPHLDRGVLEDLYASLRRTNPYIAGLKTCEQRIRDQPAPNDAHVRLIMQDMVPGPTIDRHQMRLPLSLLGIRMRPCGRLEAVTSPFSIRTDGCREYRTVIPVTWLSGTP
jgi:hypothetical protein